MIANIEVIMQNVVSHARVKVIRVGSDLIVNVSIMVSAMYQYGWHD